MPPCQNGRAESIPLPRRLRARAPSYAPVVPASHLQPLFGGEFELPFQFRAGLLAVDEIAKARAHASFAAVQSAAGLAEIRDGTEFAVDRSSGVPARVQGVAGRLGGVFVFEARVDVAD